MNTSLIDEQRIWLGICAKLNETNGSLYAPGGAYVRLMLNCATLFYGVSESRLHRITAPSESLTCFHLVADLGDILQQ